MIFRFYIDDILVDEPVGFDATKIKLIRSESYHGIIAETDSQSVEFYGNAFHILQGKYLENGIDASAILKIEYSCESGFELLGEYSITFYNSEWYCGDDCYCKVGIERKGCIYQLKNGMDTKVNLDTTLGIDGITQIGDYEYLGKDISVPSKTIRLTLSGENETDISKNILTDSEYSTVSSSIAIGGISYRFRLFHADKSILDELDTSDINQDILYKAYNVGETIVVGSDIDTYTNQMNLSLISNNYYIKGRLKTKIEFNKFETYGWTESPYCDFYLLKIKTDSSIVVLDSFIPVPTETIISSQQRNYIFDIDRSFSISEIIEPGEKIRIYSRITTGLFSPDPSLNNAILKFDVTQYKESFITITLDSLYNETNCKTYLVNEALSKTSEYVTNGCLKVYSEFLGRKDSEPFNFQNDGCGGMIALTKGQLLRQLELQLTGEQTPVFSVSFMDILKALDAIYGIGYTIEQRGDNEVLRIEDWRYFYQDNILADIGNVSVSKKPNLKLHVKNFKTGYSKYEAEESNGLDEFLTEREYSTKLVNNNLTIDKVCQFIASGYAIELTRRQGNKDTKDWRFDADTFMLCVKRSGGVLQVEQGNISNAENIIDPPTILNFRISPARMAMNLFQYLTTFIKGTKELIFSNGKGNIAAKGELINDCAIESHAISEKQNLIQDDFMFNPSGIFTAELHEIENVPLTFEQYKQIKAQPHGLIAYKCDEVQRYGWIQSLEYSFVDGDANFVLIPKND